MQATTPDQTSAIQDTQWGDIQTLLDTITDRTKVELRDPDLVRILRLRLIGFTREMPQWDVSYCIGEMADGTHRFVDLGVGFLGRQYKKDLVWLASAAGRYAKGMDLLDDNVISTLRG